MQSYWMMENYSLRMRIQANNYYSLMLLLVQMAQSSWRKMMRKLNCNLGKKLERIWEIHNYLRNLLTTD